MYGKNDRLLSKSIGRGISKDARPSSAIRPATIPIVKRMARALGAALFTRNLLENGIIHPKLTHYEIIKRFGIDFGQISRLGKIRVARSFFICGIVSHFCLY